MAASQEYLLVNQDSRKDREDVNANAAADASSGTHIVELGIFIVISSSLCDR
jgi:hypothetical protein